MRKSTKSSDPLGKSGATVVSRGLALARLHLQHGHPNQAPLDWLYSKGITAEALIRPWPINATRVRFHGWHFDFDPEGTRAITIAVFDADEIIDVAAWEPRTGKLASWLGTVFAIGQDAVFNPATYVFGRALHVHRTPLEWLRDGRCGIVILRPDLVHTYLAQRERLAFEDESFARQVMRWIQPPRPRARVFVSKRTESTQTCEVRA